MEFLQRSGQIPSDFVGILVGVNAKIAKVATLPTERDMVRLLERELDIHHFLQEQPEA